MNFEKTLARAKSILLSPKSEWPVIADEPATIKGLYTGYFMILAAIPAVFGFIKGSLIGHSLFGVTVTTSILSGLVTMVFSYVLSLVMLYVVALVINALAPTFGGRKDQLQAVKVIGYAWTAAWVAGIATIVPWLGWLVVLAGGIYSIYLLYLGLPHTMKCPPEKAAGYTVVTAIIAVVLSWIMAMLIAAATGLAGLGGATAAGLGGSGDSVRFDEDSRLGRLAALGERMQAASEASAKAEAARNRANPDGSGAGGDDPQASAEAMGAMMGAMFGDEDGKVVESLSPSQLKAFLPESLRGLQRESVSAKRSGAMGMQVSEASATYGNADRSQRITINLTDMPAMGGMMAMANAFGGESESQSADGYEKTYVRDGQRIREKWNSRTSRGEYSILVGERFQVEAEGQAESINQLKGMVGGLDLKRLAASKAEDTQEQ